MSYGVASCWTCQKPGYPGAKFFSRTECMDCANERGRREALCTPDLELEPGVARAGGAAFASESSDYRRAEHDDGNSET